MKRLLFLLFVFVLIFSQTALASDYLEYKWDATMISDWSRQAEDEWYNSDKPSQPTVNREEADKIAVFVSSHYSTYHEQDCIYVTTALEDFTAVPLNVVADKGYRPCRSCYPTERMLDKDEYLYSPTLDAIINKSGIVARFEYRDLVDKATTQLVFAASEAQDNRAKLLLAYDKIEKMEKGLIISWVCSALLFAYILFNTGTHETVNTYSEEIQKTSTAHEELTKNDNNGESTVTTEQSEPMKPDTLPSRKGRSRKNAGIVMMLAPFIQFIITPEMLLDPYQIFIQLIIAAIGLMLYLWGRKAAKSK